ncbi:MAG: amino acid transporter [Leptospiraceae bacterium]|nr:MAG: amino acid transporter [Leptospiraceae bacterium]
MHIQHYKRELGLKESLAIIIGRIIGSGIFKTPAPIMLLSGSIITFFGTWIIGGILTILSAMLYAEMVATFPKSGGPYEYLKKAYHPIVPFLRGWAMFFVSETSSIVIVSIVFSEYLLKVLMILYNINGNFLLEMSFTIMLIWIFTFLNCYGLKFSGWLQNILSLLKIFALFYIFIICFNNQPTNIATYINFDDFSLSSFFMGIGASLRYAFFAYSGWEGATYVAEEVKNPSKNLPISLFLGIICVIILYLITNLAYLSQLSPEELANSKFVAADAIQKALGDLAALIICIIIIINTASNVNAQIFTKSRTWHAMARDGLFFSFLKNLNKNSLPVSSLIFQGFWATVLTLLAYSSYFLKSSVSIYDRIIDFFSFTSAVFNVLTIIAVLILRKKYPNVYRPYKVRFLYPIFFIVLSIYGFYSFYTLYTAFYESLIGILLTLTGLIYWYFIIDKNQLKE